VTSLIDKLVGLSVRTPVATTPSSHNALRVGEREYGRRITVRAGDDEYTLVLGAAASNQVNARLQGSDDVYVATGASEWSFSDQTSRYWPTNYVNAAADGLSTITIQNDQGTLRLTRSEDGWTLDDMPADESLDAAAVEDLVSDLVRLPMGEVVAAEAAPDHGLDGGAHVLWTIDADNESIVGGYTVGREDGTDRFVRAEGQAHVIKLAASTLGALLEADRDALLTAPVADEAPAANKAPAAGRAPVTGTAPAEGAGAP